MMVRRSSSVRFGSGARWRIWARCHDLIERLHVDQGLAYQAAKQFGQKSAPSIGPTLRVHRQDQRLTLQFQRAEHQRAVIERGGEGVGLRRSVLPW